MLLPKLRSLFLFGRYWGLLACGLYTRESCAQIRDTPPGVLTQIESSVIRYPACRQDAACLECAVPPVQVNERSLSQYFQQALPLQQTRALTGTVLVHITLDAAGTPCCRLLQNFTGSPHAHVQALHLDQLVAAMPRWKPVRQDGHAVSSSTGLRMVFAGPAGLSVEPFFASGLHPQLTDSLGLTNSGWQWGVPPQLVLPLHPGEYAQFEFSIRPSGQVYAVNAVRTNASTAQEAACRQALEAAALDPVHKARQQRRGSYCFIGK